MTNGDAYAYPVANEPGLTKREWYAGLAMQGLMARGHVTHANNFRALMRDAVLAADTLIDALNEETK
jgi:hypothetical protein